MSLLTLPSELLIHILTRLSTPELLAITPTSTRIFFIVTAIIRSRIANAAPIPNHVLSFDCFHPTLRFMVPSLHCTHLQTPDLDFYAPNISTLRHLRDIYSRYRVQSATATPQQRRRPGDIPGSRTYDQSYFNPTASIASVTSSSSSSSPSSSSSSAAQAEIKPQPHHETIHLEPHELFSQLVMESNIVSGAPTLLRAFTSIGHGVVRVWREWLENAIADRSREGSGDDDASVLWLNLQKSVGLRVRVARCERRAWAHGRDVDLEGGTDSYDIEFEELLIRSSHLLLKFEDLLHTQRCLEAERTTVDMRTMFWS